jgi:hypothetical protein
VSAEPRLGQCGSLNPSRPCTSHVYTLLAIPCPLRLPRYPYTSCGGSCPSLVAVYMCCFSSLRYVFAPPPHRHHVPGHLPVLAVGLRRIRNRGGPSDRRLPTARVRLQPAAADGLHERCARHLVTGAATAAAAAITATATATAGGRQRWPWWRSVRGLQQREASGTQRCPPARGPPTWTGALASGYAGYLHARLAEWLVHIACGVACCVCGTGRELGRLVRR